MTTVNDQSSLESRYVQDGGDSVMEFNTGSSWVETNTVTDVISYASSITLVTATWDPENTFELRMRFKTGVNWGDWTSWSTSTVEREIDVPSPGNLTSFDIEGQLRKGGVTYPGPTGTITVEKQNGSD